MNATRKILALATNPADNISEIRLGQPLRALAEEGGWDLRMRPFHNVNRADLRWADVVVIQRANRTREVDLLAWLNEQGIPTIYEIDDLLTDPAEHVLSAADLRAHAHLVRQMLGMADATSASTPRLVAHLAPLAKTIQLVPNYGPPQHQRLARQDDTTQVTLVVAASDRQAVGPMAEGIRMIQADTALDVDTLAIAAIADSLEEAGVVCRRMPQMHRDAFFRTVSSLVNPIGLIPLDSSPFSACKSAVKYFDYACLGVPSICSAHPPYADVIAPGHDGLLCADRPQDWADAIRHLALTSRDRVRLTRAAREKVEKHYSLDHTKAAWSAVLTRLIDESRVVRKPVTLPQRLTDEVIIQVEHLRNALSQWNRRRLRKRHMRPMQTP